MTRKIRLYPMPVLARLKAMAPLVLTTAYTLDSASKAALVGYHLHIHTTYGWENQLEDFVVGIDRTFTALAGNTNPYSEMQGVTDMADAVKELCELVLARSADAELLKAASALLTEIESQDEAEPDDSEDEDTGSIADELDESMDGDHQSALASAGMGTDEDYGGPADEQH